MKFYVATRRQENARLVRAELLMDGHTCTASWIDLKDYGDGGKTEEQLREIALTCEREVRAADVLVLVSEQDGAYVPGGKHVETGMALAWNKVVLVLGPPENVFHRHPLVVGCDSIDQVREAFATIAQLRVGA